MGKKEDLERNKAVCEGIVRLNQAEIEAIDRQLESMNGFEVVSASGTLWEFGNDGEKIRASFTINNTMFHADLFKTRASVRDFCDRLTLLAEGFEND